MGTENVSEDDGQKKGRRRKKLLYNSILQQMEFYFSDSNLSKDRFLSTLTKEDPYVDVSVFLKFNKIRKLTTSVKDITKAVAKSDILELSEDKSKVKRKLPIIAKSNVEECTLYVERLKSDVTHEWLSTIFSDFGKVAYVSIPKYKHSGMIKGFAFVEFEQEESVQATLQYFEQIDCKIPTCMEPENLCSIVTYNIEKNAVHKSLSSENEDEPPTKKVKIEEDLKKSFSSENDDEPPTKKVKLEEEVKVEVVEEKKNSDAVEDTDQDISTSDKRKKKQKKSNKKKANLKALGLRILSKKDWKKMRNRYLDMQRKSMKKLKMHLNRQRFAQKYDVYKSQTVNDVKTEQQEDKVTSLETELKFVPRVIVKFSLQEPCYTPKLMRRKIKTFSPNIKYVEVPFGNAEAYLRFGDSNLAEEFCSSDFKDQSTLLEGDEEKEYWNKIGESASAKKEKQTKTNKKRGRDKLLKKGEKHAVDHIRFNEEAVE